MWINGSSVLDRMTDTASLVCLPLLVGRREGLLLPFFFQFYTLPL